MSISSAVVGRIDYCSYLCPLAWRFSEKAFDSAFDFSCQVVAFASSSRLLQDSSSKVHDLAVC